MQPTNFGDGVRVMTAPYAGSQPEMSREMQLAQLEEQRQTEVAALEAARAALLADFAASEQRLSQQQRGVLLQLGNVSGYLNC